MENKLSFCEGPPPSRGRPHEKRLTLLSANSPPDLKKFLEKSRTYPKPLFLWLGFSLLLSACMPFRTLPREEFFEGRYVPPEPAMDPSLSRAISQYLRAQFALKQGDVRTAREALKEVIRLDPGASLPRLKLIGLLILENDLEGAKHVFFSGPLNPESLATPLLRLYVFWAIQGNQKEKVLTGLKILGERKEGALELVLYAILRIKEGFPLNHLEGFLQGSGEEKKFLPCLRGYLSFPENLESAEPFLLRCFEEVPQWLPALYELAYLSELKKNRDQALLWYRRIKLIDSSLTYADQRLQEIAAQPDLPPTPSLEELKGEILYTGYLYLVDRLLKGNEPQIALQILTDLPHPWKEHPRTLLIQTYIREGLTTGYDSLPLYLRIYPLASTGLKRFIALALIRTLKERNPERWEEDLKKLFSTYEKDSALYYAWIKGVAENQEEKMLPLFEEAARRFPEDLVILYDLGVLYEKRKRRDEALMVMEKIITLDPWHADALNFLGYSWAEKGIRLPEAHRYIKMALELKPYAGYIMDSMGWVLFQEGKASEAIPWLEKAVEKEGPDPIILEHLGDAYAVIGEDEKARETYRKALENLEDDKSEDEKRILEKIQKTYDRKL